MTTPALTELLNRLDQTARQASTAEDAFRREAVEKIRALEHDRIYAFRRLNLVRSVVAAMAGAENEEQASARGRTALLNELNWTGASEAQREVTARFQPVLDLLWRMQEGNPAGKDEPTLEQALAAFERWFGENRKGSFMSLMDGEPLELPLVEI